jgi:glyoxylase-like metal-dependent hydrolase (beta-lactamase superfamily II)
MMKGSFSGGQKVKLLDNLYAYLWPGVSMAEMQTYGNNSNTYVIATALPEGRHIIIDPGQVANEAHQPCLDILVAGMERDGLKIEDTGLIINTHGHPDHYGASQAIRARSQAQVTIGKTEHQSMQKLWEQMAGQPGMMAISMPEIEVDFYLQEGDLNLNGEIALKILSIPGHSPGHIGIYWPEAKVFIGGDLIFYGSTGRVDLPGGSARLLKESIERVSGLEIEYLLTGHQYGAPGIIQGAEQIARNFDFLRKNIFPYL